MKAVRFFVIAVVLMVPIYLFFFKSDSDTSTLPIVGDPITVEEIRAYVDQGAENWTNHDAKSISSELDEDVVVVFSWEQGPIIGRDFVVRGYAMAWIDGSPLKGCVLTSNTLVGNDLGSGYCYADGTWQMTTPSGELLDEGKWGSVFKNTANGLRAIQESVFSNIDENNTLTPPTNTDPFKHLQPLSTLDLAFKEHIEVYEKAWENQDVDALAASFTKDAVRIIGTAPEAIRGREAIRESFAAGFGEDSPFKGTKLSAVVLGYRFLDNQHFTAHGTWKLLDASGAVMAQGQWGNLYRREEDGVVRFLMESAGAMTFDQN